MAYTDRQVVGRAIHCHFGILRRRPVDENYGDEGQEMVMMTIIIIGCSRRIRKHVWINF
jgi:hypothetical protein